MKEKWRKWRSGDYEVSNFGRIRRSMSGRRTYVGRVLNPVMQKVGYWSVRPVVDGRNVQMYVHRMVAECFIGECPNGHEVNHVDGDKTNNVVTNLEYVTHERNMQHASELGLSAQGERHGASVLRDVDVRSIRRLRAKGWTLGDLSERFGVGKPTLSQIANSITWRHVS